MERLRIRLLSASRISLKDGDDCVSRLRDLAILALYALRGAQPANNESMDGENDTTHQGELQQ